MFLVYLEGIGGQMRKCAFVFIAISLILVARASQAGDVVYTLWEDDGGQFWVRIQNDTDHTIRVQSILIVYYNQKGKPIDQQNIPCTGNCRLSPHDTKDFGPYQPPANTEALASAT